MKITFVIGGARSGKSSFALKQAEKIKGRKAYIATAQAFDEEMKERIEKHKKDRSKDWDTFEEPLKVADALNEIANKYDAVVLDCLTLWLSNLMLKHLDCNKEMDTLFSALKDSKLKTRDSKLLLVSNEVGLGIVPDNELARRFRDWAGILNQRVAEVADEVYLVTAGIPVKIK